MFKQYFILKTPNGYIGVWLSRNHRDVVFEGFAGIRSSITPKAIRPDQLVYVIKEFNLLDTFRRRVYNYLRHLNQAIAFDITNTKTNSLIDHAW